MAKERGKQWLVVCNEHPGSDENRKIAFVCKRVTIECISFREKMQLEGWQFR